MVAPAAAPSRTRARILFAAKLILAGVLITWLVRSGSLKFGALDVFIKRPLLLVGSLSLSGLGVMAGALRWLVLLRIAKVRMPFARALQLQATALFFNLAIPGGVGGDVIKSAYAAREAEPAMRPTIFVVAFVERLLGLGALVLVAGIVILLRGGALWNDPQLRDLALAVAAIAAITLVGPVGLITIVRRAGPRLESWTSGPSAFAKLARLGVSSARLVSAGPKELAIALVLSMTLHAMSMGFFTLLAVAITAQEVSFSAVASIFPLGILTIVVPISPGGIGVGHAAFDKLFSMIGVSGGASVFNAYLIGQVSPSLLGVFPYLALRRSNALPPEVTTPPP